MGIINVVAYRLRHVRFRHVEFVVAGRKRRIELDYDSYAAMRSERRLFFAQASGVISFTCQLVIEGSRVKTSRR